MQSNDSVPGPAPFCYDLAVMNVPNRLTVARLVLTIVFVALMAFDTVVTYALAYVVFVVAAFTDYLDGKIARAQGLVSNFGKLLDPVADKVLVVAALVVMLTIPELQIPPWTLVAILAREFIVTGARALAAAEGAVIAAARSGKIKTVLQMGYIIVFLLLACVLLAVRTHPDAIGWLPIDPEAFVTYVGWASQVSIALVALYTVYTGVEFARTNWTALRLDDM